MRATRGLATSVVAAITLLHGPSFCAGQHEQWPVRDTETGDTTVTWDHYSVMINGERILSFGGEFHPFRIPVPEMWWDVLEKMKAMGLNSMAFYNHWGFSAHSDGKVNLETGAHDLARLYEYAKQAGLYVSSRPGPYINGELSGGGLPLWVTTGEYGGLRNNATAFRKAWEPYLDKFDEITKPYQISENGTIFSYQIENEFPEQWKSVSEKIPNPVPINYMEQLFDKVQSNGIVIPITHNMPGPRYKSWSVDYDDVGAGGNVHIYGLDNYPTCWSCISSDCSSSNPSFTLFDYVAQFEEVSNKQPSMMPEFQGGATNPWAGPADGCRAKTDDRFVSLYYRDNIAQRVTVLNLYMIYGGTNWGSMAAPFQTSSYDYSAAISENRTLDYKYYEIKNLALFTRVAHDLTKTDLVGNSTTVTDNEAITTIELRNPDNDAGFYALRHTDPTSKTAETFRLSVRTGAGNYSIPTMSDHFELTGNYAKFLVADFNFAKEKLYYSTAEVLTYGLFDDQPTIAFWVFNGEGGEFLIANATSARVTAGDKSKIRVKESKAGITVNFRDQAGRTVLQLNSGVRVIIFDRNAAHRFWVPALTIDPRVPEDQVVFVRGPYLVRNARINRQTLALQGDSDKATDIEVFTTKKVKVVTWNGKELRTKRTDRGSLEARIDGPATFAQPVIEGWKVRDSLPERFTNYSDTGIAWAVADHMTTPNLRVNSSTATRPYLLGSDYGFHHGIKLWRARFNGEASGMFIRSQGGLTHGWTAYLNGVFIESFEGTIQDNASDRNITFPQHVLTEDENILLIVQDNAGHEQLSRSLNPRGILNATLLDNDEGFTSWKVAGHAGGALGQELDPIRTDYSHGGLSAERLGWHLPGFDDGDWESGSPSDGFSGAGIRFYRANLPLDTPEGHDVSLSVKLDPKSQKTSQNNFRAYIFINGYQYGRYFPYFAKDRNTFPVPPGIWNYKGDNTVGVAIWNQEEEEVKLDVSIQVDYVVTSALNVKFDASYLQPPWNEERSLYI